MARKVAKTRSYPYINTLFVQSTWFSTYSCLISCGAVKYRHVPGIRRYCDNMKMLLGFDVGVFMKTCWMVLTPIGTLVSTQ